MTTMVVDLSRSWNENCAGTEDARSQIVSLPKVKNLKKLPLDGVRETYKWRVTLPLLGDKRTMQQIKDIVRYHSLDGERHKGTICEHFKTGGMYFIQTVLPGEDKNRELLNELRDLWQSLGWQNITIRQMCGWVSMSANKKRFA